MLTIKNRFLNPLPRSGNSRTSNGVERIPNRPRQPAGFTRLGKVKQRNRVSLFKPWPLGNSLTGFSLVEIVVSTVVISIMIIALANLMIGVGIIQRQNDHLALANRVGEAKIESLRNNHFNNLALSPPPLDFTSELPAELPSPRSAQVSVSEPSAGLKRLDISITYREGMRDKTVQLSALLGNIGISQ